MIKALYTSSGQHTFFNIDGWVKYIYALRKFSVDNVSLLFNRNCLNVRAVNVEKIFNLAQGKARFF
jgi:hypothetical protein